MLGVWQHFKLQALVDDVLPSTTAVFSYAIGSPENCQLTSSFFLVCFFVGVQTVVGLL